LSPSLVSDNARAVIEIAARHGALGWKVNGAGGEGGSLTILGGPSPTEKRRMLREIEAMGNGIRHLFVYLSRYGVRVWEAR